MRGPRIIISVRDPSSWMASYIHLKKMGGDFDKGLSLYSEFLDYLLRLLNENHPFLVIRYEDLISSTPVIMRKIADWLDIGFEEGLCRPTVNGLQSKPNTSFPADIEGDISKSTLSRRHYLAPTQQREIDRQLMARYQTVLGEAQKRNVLVDCSTNEKKHAGVVAPSPGARLA